MIFLTFDQGTRSIRKERFISKFYKNWTQKAATIVAIPNYNIHIRCLFNFGSYN